MPQSFVLLSLVLSLFTFLSQGYEGPTHDAWSRILKPCPRDCSDSSPAEWATYNELGRLAACNQTLRVQFSLYNPSSSIRACSVSSNSPAAQAVQGPASSKEYESQEVIFELGWWDTPTSSSPVGAINAVEEARRTLLASSNNQSTTAFSYSGNSLVGLYAGHGVLHSDAAATALQHFTRYLESQKTIGRVLLQYCGVNSNKALGVVLDTTGDFPAVQRIMRDWNEAKCQTTFDGSKKLPNIALRLERPFAQTSPTTHNLNHRNSHKVHSIHRRGTCKTIQVSSGDSCGSLAKECGITGAKFEKYNSGKKLCSTLSVGQYVCCTPGGLPDLTPKPKPDGTCASTLVEPGDLCSTIAAANGITPDDLEKFNKKTWGWAGCKHLQPKQRICLSKGEPAMPESLDNAVCGPQVPGTKKPGKGKDLADLNPCPLKSCCNIWGQCGITDDFCTITKSETGAPGTAAKGTYGCISNCGTDIVNNDSPPKDFITIGYFEAWNFERKCLNMDIAYFDTSAYSHLHFAFAEITKDYEVDVSAVQSQFDSLLSMGDVHRVLSFGGWSFSTEVDSFPIFRQGVSDANRELFATNVVKFIVDNDLEGVDFDWEYPGAPDIPGIPAGDKGDGERYLHFLKLVREKLPKEKTLAIAAPASFWYLKGFPIAEISKVVDYIVYMTYDLHGQWDYGNQYSTSGCSEGDCLRSHVNLTETTSALSMITKAGVPSDKIIVGLASYGRSFKMTKAGCTGPMCRFVGPESGAAKGECTDTAGYISDAEIYRILEKDDTAKTFYDKSSDSNILVYGSTEWVAFMDRHTRTSRTGYYERLNMGGTTDWAVDLQQFGFSGSGGRGGNGDGGGSLNQSIVYISPSIWTDAKDPAPVECPAPCVLVLPDFPLSSTSVISRPPYVTTLEVAWPTAATLTTGGSTVTTTTVTRILQETTIKAPAVTVTSLPMANLNITVPIKGNRTITITPKPRFPAQTVTITNDPNPLSLTGVSHPPVTRSVTLPPWPQGTVIYYPKDSVNKDDDDNKDDNNKDDDNKDDDNKDDDNKDDDNKDDDNKDDDNKDDNNKDDDNKDDDNKDDDNKDDDNDIHLPPIPIITVKDGPGSPRCGTHENCGSLCSGPLSFCSCFICPGGGGAGDGGFSDPKDPNPPPRPPGDPVSNNKNDPNDLDKSCTKKSTRTNYWVSCKSEDSTSTSCTTTSSMLAIGCDITATTTTTGQGVCASFDPDEDQGDRNGRLTGQRPTPISTVPATTTTTSSAKQPSTSSETKTSTKTSKTSSLPSATAANGCSLVGHGPSTTKRCWNKCDPGTGAPVGGDWAENDPWCWIADSGKDWDAYCLKQSDCPTDFVCSESWGCPAPLSGGCASQGGKIGISTCWASCNEKTGKRTKDKWEKGMPWCWLQNGRAFSTCDEDSDCSATTECVPNHWQHGGCGRT